MGGLIEIGDQRLVLANKVKGQREELYHSTNKYYDPSGMAYLRARYYMPYHNIAFVVSQAQQNEMCNAHSRVAP